MRSLFQSFESEVVGSWERKQRDEEERRLAEKRAELIRKQEEKEHRERLRKQKGLEEEQKKQKEDREKQEAERRRLQVRISMRRRELEKSWNDEEAVPKTPAGYYRLRQSQWGPWLGDRQGGEWQESDSQEHSDFGGYRWADFRDDEDGDRSWEQYDQQGNEMGSAAAGDLGGWYTSCRFSCPVCLPNQNQSASQVATEPEYFVSLRDVKGVHNRSTWFAAFTHSPLLQPLTAFLLERSRRPPQTGCRKHVPTVRPEPAPDHHLYYGDMAARRPWWLFGPMRRWQVPSRVVRMQSFFTDFWVVALLVGVLTVVFVLLGLAWNRMPSIWLGYWLIALGAVLVRFTRLRNLWNWYLRVIGFQNGIMALFMVSYLSMLWLGMRNAKEPAPRQLRPRLASTLDALDNVIHEIGVLGSSMMGVAAPNAKRVGSQELFQADGLAPLEAVKVVVRWAGSREGEWMVRVGLSNRTSFR